MKRILVLIIIIISINAKAQSKFEANGYVKFMQTVLPLPDTIRAAFGTDVLATNLVHHRLNMAYYANDRLTFKAELRDRLMYGDLAPVMGSQADLGNDVFTLSTYLIEGNNLYWHLIFDRMYGEYISGDWEIRAGRQRINWGINTIYNPNDIFNAANFFDFDYEERSGSDAIRITKYAGVSSSFELAFKYFDKVEDAVGALLWKTTKWNFDLQFLGGVSQMDAVIGCGWSGYIKEKYGFKGEASYFQPYQNLDSTGTMVYSLATDFSLKEDWLFMGGVLYNQQAASASNSALDMGQALTSLNSSVNMSAKNLSTTAWTFMAIVSKPINAQLAWSTALIAMPHKDLNTGIWVNTITYSVKDNWDIDLVNQTILTQSQDMLGGINMMNFRLKYAY